MSRRLLVALLALATLAVLGLGAVAAAARPSAPDEAFPRAASVVLVGTGGLTWSDVSREGTPTLWRLLREGSSGAMSVRSVETNTCPVDGWLGLSAGARAAAPRERAGPGRETAQDRPCPPVPEVTGGRVPGWAAYVSSAEQMRFGSRPGTLAEAAAAAGRCVSAVGPGAGLAAATRDGRVARYLGWQHRQPSGRPPPAGLAAALRACPVTVVDVGSVRDPADVAAGEPAPSVSRVAQVAAVDARLGEVIAAAPTGADVLVGSLADAGRSERLRLAGAVGPDYGPGRLLSPSTKQPGLVQAHDLPVTALAVAGVPAPSRLGGAVLGWEPTEGATGGVTGGAAGGAAGSAAGGATGAAAQERLRALVDYDLASSRVHSLVPPFFTVFAYGQLGIYLLVLLVWRGRLGTAATRRSVLRWVRVVAVAAASVPAATFLANLLPWWRLPVPMAGVVAAVGVFVAVTTTAALLGPWAHDPVGPMASVAATTMAVLAGDILSGSRLQLSSLMGLQPVVAGRFYGMGNVTFGLFATSALLLATAVSSVLVRRGRRLAGALAVVWVGGLALVVNGAPFWGADGGGPPALLPGVAYLSLAVLGVSLTWRRVLLIGVTSVAVFTAVAVLDWLRPPASRTHLGRFVSAVLDGGALDIVVRKAQQNLSILLGNAPLTLLVPAALLFVIYVLARPTSWGSRALQRSFDAAPTLRAGLVAVVVTLTIGFLINDSGTAVPAVGAMVAVPLLVSVAVRVLEDEARPHAAASSLRAARRTPAGSSVQAAAGGAAGRS